MCPDRLGRVESLQALDTVHDGVTTEQLVRTFQRIEASSVAWSRESARNATRSAVPAARETSPDSTRTMDRRSSSSRTDAFIQAVELVAVLRRLQDLLFGHRSLRTSQGFTALYCW